ncbi:hypothetical protein, partial [Streptomyces sp. WAC05950]|uniref:hypothetical protein n=1 Tax=Streptomyces sp. WAC05950 TaxID=2487419 RepID=UPI00163C3073
TANAKKRRWSFGQTHNERWLSRAEQASPFVDGPAAAALAQGSDLEQFQRQLDEVHKRARSRLESAGLVIGLDTINCLICVACEGWKTGEDGKCANCPHDSFSPTLSSCNPTQ